MEWWKTYVRRPLSSLEVGRVIRTLEGGAFLPEEDANALVQWADRLYRRSREIEEGFKFFPFLPHMVELHFAIKDARRRISTRSFEKYNATIPTIRSRLYGK